MLSLLAKMAINVYYGCACITCGLKSLNSVKAILILND